MEGGRKKEKSWSFDNCCQLGNWANSVRISSDFSFRVTEISFAPQTASVTGQGTRHFPTLAPRYSPKAPKRNGPAV